MVLIMRVRRANNCTKMRGFVAVVTIKTVRRSDRTSQPQMDEHKPSKMQLQPRPPIVRGGNFWRGPSVRAHRRAIPYAYDARATHPGSGRRRGSLSARADRASRFHLDAIDATDEADDATDAIWTHNTPNLEHPPRARRRPFQMLERLGGRRPRRSI